MPPHARLLPALLALTLASLAAPTHAQTTPPVPANLPAPAVSDSVLQVGSAPEGPPAPLHPHWALVLSGGAARGIAHIGVLRALEEEGIRPDLVCGTSMGALIGALYSSGYTSEQIRDIVRKSDWDEIFGREKEHFEWRDTVIPQPWLTLIGQGLQLHLPSGVVDDSYLNFTLAAYYLPAEAMARGDFDRLPIPFRCVGTDAETTNPIVFRSGSIARAVRASISIPPLFPAVPDGRTLLVDGGLASNLPVSAARVYSPAHVLAVDVSLPPVDLNERSSLLEVAFSVFDKVNKRSQLDTLSADSDRLVWLKLPRYGPMDFIACDSLIELGYRECHEQIHEFALMLTADTATTRSEVAPAALLPPARPEVAWLDRDGHPSPRASAARHMFGRTPAGAFKPDTLRPAFDNVYRGDMFTSAWATFRVTGDSTTIAMNVESRPASEMLFAFGYDNDLHGRVNGTLVLRPLKSRLPDKISIGAIVDPRRTNVFFALEPHSLARGADGWFLRGGVRQTDVRIFDADRNVEETTVKRIEALAGLQKRLTRAYLLQAGAGYGFAGGDAPDLSGVLASVRIQSGSAFGEGIQASLLAGNESYAEVVARAALDVRAGPVVVRTSVRAGSSSKRTPADELQFLGGPESLAGLRRREWLGHDRVAGELRFIHNVTSYARVFVYGQGGLITQSVSRPDLNGNVHLAAGAGLEAAVPFGPLNLDWGIDDEGEFRLDFNFGQRF